MLLEKSATGWELHTIANGKLSCENGRLLPEDIDQLERGLFPTYKERMEKESVMVAYDNWSGVYIMQNIGVQTDTADELIKEIYEWLKLNYTDK